MKRLIVVMLMSLVFLAGCNMRFPNGDIKPSYPDLGYTNRPAILDTLTPTFRWTSEAKAPSTYDFAIWDISPQVVGFSMASQRPIYYKEALPQPEHKIEIPLAPNTIYAWSVRTRSEGKVSAWMTYNYYYNFIIVFGNGKNWPYRFKTPEIDIKDAGVDMKTGQAKQ
jgi:hypothetical protein